MESEIAKKTANQVLRRALTTTNYNRKLYRVQGTSNLAKGMVDSENL